MNEHLWQAFQLDYLIKDNRTRLSKQPLHVKVHFLNTY